MNTYRQQTVVRWGFVVLIALGIFVYSYSMMPPIYPVAGANVPRMAPLPSAKDQKILTTAAEGMPLNIYMNPEKSVNDVFQVTPVESLAANRVPVSLTMLFFGEKNRYAVINGEVFHEGDEISAGKVLQKVRENSVVISGGAQSEVVEWVSPGLVRLR